MKIMLPKRIENVQVIVIRKSTRISNVCFSHQVWQLLIK